VRFMILTASVRNVLDTTSYFNAVNSKSMKMNVDVNELRTDYDVM
jgi:hypothetical protein